MILFIFRHHATSIHSSTSIAEEFSEPADELEWDAYFVQMEQQFLGPDLIESLREVEQHEH